MGGGGHAREKDHQNVKSLIIFANDCTPPKIRIKRYLYITTTEQLTLLTQLYMFETLY
jgi:hypothetical protein